MYKLISNTPYYSEHPDLSSNYITPIKHSPEDNNLPVHLNSIRGTYILKLTKVIELNILQILPNRLW